MGKWDRRYYLPRKKSRRYDYEDPPLSPPNTYDNQSYPSGFADNRVPLWEVDYCTSARVPWKKVVASKKYIYCYPSVLDWDGSAAKDALHNAKERFWAMKNGLPHNNPLPDPDLYIDEIDWNPHVDPELMAELDLPVFDPDKVQKVEILESIDEGVECAQIQDDNKCASNNPWERDQGAGSLNDTIDNRWGRNNTPGAGSSQDANDNPWERNNTQGIGSSKYTSDNPWERNNTQGTGSSKDLQGWDRWGDTVSLGNGKKWEQSCSQQVDSSKDNAWRGGNESWCWQQWNGSTRSSTFIDHGCGSSWNFNGQTTAVRQGGQGWGRGHRENNSRCWGTGNTNVEGKKNLVNNGYSFENNCSADSKVRGWRDKKKESWGGRNSEYQGNEPNYWDSQTFRRGGGSFHGGCRKRESSLQHSSKYKSSKYHGDTCGDSRQS